jgi:hypothetical protein
MVLFSRTAARMRLAALIVIAIIGNPRLNAYDFAYAALPAFYIYATRLEDLVGAARSAWLSLVAAALVAAGSCALYMQFSWTFKAFLMAFLAGAVVAATQWPLVARFLPIPRAAAPKPAPA